MVSIKHFLLNSFGGVLKLLCKDHVNIKAALRSRVRIEVRPTENDSTRLYKNGGISVVITCS